MADYSVSEAFQEIESYLISSMMRNMSHHLDLEKAEGISYTQWQAEQLAALAEFRTANRQQFNGYFSRINTRIEEALRKAYALGGMQQEAAILEALKKGWSGRRDSGSDKLAAEFFRINERKLNSYIKAVMKDMRSAETALLRMADDQYRKAIFNAGVAYNTGIYTLPQAIDAATRDYLSRGIACIEYKNGARVLIDTYAEMALRTSATRCYLQGESAKRDEWGVNTVIVNRRGSACPKCLQYVGKVFYDDVYGNLPVPDSRYPKLSEAIKGGLYHPNCKDIHTTYFEGISDPPKPLTADEECKANEVYRLEQQQRYNERQIRKYRRLAEYTIDPEQKQKYSDRLKRWEKVNAMFVAEHGDVLKRRYEREAIRDLTVRVERPPTVHRLSENTNSPEKSLDKSVESGIINNRDSEFFERLRNGLINTTIDEGAQKQHYDIKAWKNQRKQAMAKYLLGQRDDKAIPTALLMQSLNPQELVNKYAGKGVLVWRGKNEYPNEFIQLDHPVGITFDKKKGHYIFTDVIEIRYTAKGTHIFPTIRRGGIFRV